MRIEFDGQLLAEKEKTGIGFVAHQLLCNLSELSQDLQKAVAGKRSSR